MITPTGNTNTMPGRIYTMLSRAKSTKGLKLCSFDSKKIKMNEAALLEMKRLKNNCVLETVTLGNALQPLHPPAGRGVEFAGCRPAEW